MRQRCQTLERGIIYKFTQEKLPAAYSQKDTQIIVKLRHMLELPINRQFVGALQILINCREVTATDKPSMGR
jgi:hypothetical protein